MCGYVSRFRDEGAPAQEGGGKPLTEDDIETNWDECIETFDAMELREELLRGIYAYGFEKPSAIQQVCDYVLLLWERDADFLLFSIRTHLSFFCEEPIPRGVMRCVVFYSSLWAFVQLERKGRKAGEKHRRSGEGSGCSARGADRLAQRRAKFEKKAPTE